MRKGAVTSRLDEVFEGVPKLLGIQEAADLLGMTKRGVYQWIRHGVIPAYKLGSLWFVVRDDLRDSLAAGLNSPVMQVEPDAGPTHHNV